MRLRMPRRVTATLALMAACCAEAAAHHGAEAGALARLAHHLGHPAHLLPAALAFAVALAAWHLATRRPVATRRRAGRRP